MRCLLSLVMVVSLIGETSARESARRMVVHGKTLHLSPALKRQIDEHQQKADWKGKFTGWTEAKRFRRLRDGSSSDDYLHIGKAQPSPYGGQKWLVRLSQQIAAPPPEAPSVSHEQREMLSGLGLSVVRAGPHLGSRVFGATTLPNGHTLEVTAEFLEAKRQVRFEVLTWNNAFARDRVAPSGKFVVRDASGTVVAEGPVRSLWRKANAKGETVRKWTSSVLGLEPQALKELLVDLTG